MNIHDATEQAFKNGYKAGVTEFAERFEEELGESFFNHYPFVLTTLDNVVADLMEERK